MELGKQLRAGASLNGDRDDLSKPESCLQAGLECRGCVRHTAMNLAALCQNLEIDAIRDSFLKIYPDNACLPMARTFIRAYRATANEAAEIVEDCGLLTVAPA